ncbi:MAG: transposase, partial [Vulcanimicrobiaceae bacterium]
MARSTAYYRERERVAVVDDVMAQRIKQLIDAEPYLGYRMVWARLRRQGLTVNRKAVQRIMQVKGWQCHRRLKKRCSPRVESSPSVTTVSDVRWATDSTLLWTRLDGLVYVNAILDCADRECIGLNVSQRNDAREAAWALEDALIRRFGALPQGDADVTLRTDNALVYASALYRDLAKSYGLHQEFILPHTPEQNGVAESFMGTLKLECVWQHLRNLRRGEGRNHGLGAALQRAPAAFAARLPPAGRMAPPATRIKRLTCPETAGSL